MNLREIEQCLQKCADELNRFRGIVVRDDRGGMKTYVINGKHTSVYYSKVSVDGADLVLDSNDLMDEDSPCTGKIRIPYHSILEIELETRD